MQRYLAQQVRADLMRKMVFLAGPRQVGKTTVARSLVGDRPGYMSWDVPADREALLRGRLPIAPLLALDEIHKDRAWRALLKGLWDGRVAGQQILVTGSARLDFYRHGGDSLQGRYHFLRLHPLSVAELGITDVEAFRGLLTLGGFPEPFLGGSETEARRWSREYRVRLAQEDVRDLERVADLGRLERLMLRLPELVGSPLSLNALSEDLQVSHRAVSHWVEILERLYAVFRVPPFGTDAIRAVKKAQKHYHLDWSLVPEPGARFENLVAAHLLKWVHHEQDTQGREVELRYVRDVDGREVDFVLVERGRPLEFIEAKLSAREAPPALRHLKAKFPKAKATLVVAEGGTPTRTPDGIETRPAWDYLGSLV
ncbi:MAG: ATP-binding protein [Verrucomicrobiae bacterium]|nr:ATP-binding protein [Verrucomicrobiae bacterium]